MNLSVFLGSVFSWVSIRYSLCNVSHSSAAAHIHFLHCHLLADFAYTSLKSTVSTIPCRVGMDPDLQLLPFCFYGSQEYQSTQTRSGPISSSRTRCDPGSDFRIRVPAACRHNRFLLRDWASWAYRMYSTKSSTSVIPSFSIKKLSSLEQCSQQLHEYCQWSCCQRTVCLSNFDLKFKFTRLQRC